jgi:hypothetical protein
MHATYAVGMHCVCKREVQLLLKVCCGVGIQLACMHVQPMQLATVLCTLLLCPYARTGMQQLLPAFFFVAP